MELLSTVTTYLLYILLPFVIFHIWSRYNRKGRLFSKIPGPKPYPIVGNLLMFTKCTPAEIWDLGRTFMKQYYPILRIWGVEKAMVSICHPDDLEILLSSQKVIEKGYAYWFLQPWLKFGLLTSTDDKWRQRRKLLTPAFHFGILKKYIDITNEQGEKMIEALKSENEVTVRSLIPFCSNYTLNIILESTMGVALDKLPEGTVLEYKQAVHNMGKVVVWRLLQPYVPNFLIPYVPKVGPMQVNALKKLHGFSDQVIKQRREFHASTENKFLNQYTDITEEKVFDDFDIGRKKRLSMLDLLLSAERNNLIDNEGIKEEVDTFTFEGHDTSAMAMTYTLMLLAENKEAQDRARDEITELFDRNNGKIDIVQLQELHYLERCIKESIRLYPPVATLMRNTTEDLQLKHGLIPAETHIMMHLWDTHRDPKFWTDPDKFEPDRFLPENSKNRHPFAYVPFSAGPRNCIGQKFAVMELKSLIGKILYDFYLEPVDLTTDMKLTGDIILRPQDPVHIKFIRINK